MFKRSPRSKPAPAEPLQLLLELSSNNKHAVFFVLTDPASSVTAVVGTHRYCDEDVCPVGRGECRAARGGSGDDYVTVSKCYCFYGYGGEACGQRVVSYVSLLWQVGG